MERRLPPRVGEGVDKWNFHGEAPLEMPCLPALAEANRARYMAGLQQPCTPNKAAQACLKALFESQTQDPIVARAVLVASVGYFDDEEEQQVHSFYENMMLDLFGRAKIPATSLMISVVYRLLRHYAEKNTTIARRYEELLAHQPVAPPLPEFRFFFKLQARPGFQLLLGEDFVAWLAPQPDIAFAFANGNWATLGLFREVLDAILGRHLARPETLDVLKVYRDPNCSQMALDDEALTGDFFIVLNTGKLAAIPRFTRFETKAPHRTSTFRAKVMYQAQARCEFSTSTTRTAEDDLEVAHIWPRTGHLTFLSILQRYLPYTRVTCIDDPCNGMSLWRGLHGPWDGGRAAIFVLQQRLIFSRARHPLSLLQSVPPATGSLDDPSKPEKLVLLKLRLTQILLIWFATPDFEQLLASLGSPVHPTMVHVDRERADDEMGSSEGDPHPGQSISPSNSNSSNSSAGVSGASASTAPASPPLSPTAEDPKKTEIMTGVTGEVVEDENSADPDDEAELPTKAIHHAGCSCDIDADENGPCVLLVVGATQLWTAFR
ncbi:hypothetical protein C8F01DRAFT_303201 [Mycena amicta]|nr:hypothetical protein C8F01DRAFT_303201 [Mycena amicta]